MLFHIQAGKYYANQIEGNGNDKNSGNFVCQDKQNVMLKGTAAMRQENFRGRR
jgi:hypothetical protein